MLTGILPVLCTPFGSDGSVDAAALARLVRFVLASGAHGLVFPGFASEVDELTADERLALLKVVVNEAGGRVPVVAGASSASTDDVIARCREALALGIDHAMIQAPKSIGADAAAVSRFYGEIARALPEVTIILQNAPMPRGSDLSAASILTVLRDNPTIRYVKEETLPAGPSISALVSASAPNLLGVIGGGGARYLIEELHRGAIAAMPAAEFTDVHVQLYAAWTAGDEALARTLYERLLPLLVIQAFSRMRFTKHVLARRAILSNDIVRAKIPPFDGRDIAEIDALLGRIADLLGAAPLARMAA